jgi:hypothetical protein
MDMAELRYSGIPLNYFSGTGMTISDDNMAFVSTPVYEQTIHP